MRLTLRTLLAYLDNSSVLKPDEAEQLAKKIQESEFASGLVNRIQGVLHKLRMPAPKLDAKGAADCNTVAEYIDGLLADERVAEYEKLCLESDIHLSEVASALQVLAQVMGEPVTPSPALREKVYGLYALRNDLPPAPADAGRVDPAHEGADKVDGKPAPAGRTHDTPAVHKAATAEVPPPKAGEAAAPAAASAAATGKSEKPAPAASPASSAEPMQVPDYLLAARRPSWATYLGTSAAALLVIVALARLAGPFDGSHPLAQLLGWGGPTVALAPQPPSDTPPSVPPPPSPAPPVAPAPADPAVPPGPPAPGALKAPTEVPPLPPVPANNPPPVNPPGVNPPAAIPPAANPPAANPPAINPPGVNAPAVNPPAGNPPPPPADPKASPVPPVENAPGASPAPPKPLEPPADPMPAAEVGRLVTDDQPLAMLVDDGQGAGPLWFRVPPRALLPAGQRLVSLPVFRPQLALPGGVQATLAGEAAVRLSRQKETGAPLIRLEYGRLQLVSVAAEGAVVALQFGGIEGQLSMTSPDSALAIEVRQFLPPAADPLKNPAAAVTYADFYVTGGEVVWRQGEQQVKLSTHSVLALGPESRVFEQAAPPAWLDTKSIPDLDRRAALDLEPLLEVQKPLEVPLLEQAASRRGETRSLASRGLAALDDYEPLLRLFADPRHFNYWQVDLETLRRFVAASPERAAQVKDTLQRIRGNEAELLYTLIVGHDNPGLARGGAAEVVKLLESDSLDLRVLASEELRRITGVTFNYRPERHQDTASKAALQRWKDRVKTGLQYATTPTGASEFKPLK